MSAAVGAEKVAGGGFVVDDDDDDDDEIVAPSIPTLNYYCW